MHACVKPVCVCLSLCVSVCVCVCLCVCVCVHLWLGESRSACLIFCIWYKMFFCENGAFLPLFWVSGLRLAGCGLFFGWWGQTSLCLAHRERERERDHPHRTNQHLCPQWLSVLRPIADLLSVIWALWLLSPAHLTVLQGCNCRGDTDDVSIPHTSDPHSGLHSLFVGDAELTRFPGCRHLRSVNLLWFFLLRLLAFLSSSERSYSARSNTSWVLPSSFICGHQEGKRCNKTVLEFIRQCHSKGTGL